MDKTIDLSTLTLDDLKDEYLALKQNYLQLRSFTENDAQRIHELKRSLETALAAQEYMAQELEQCSNNMENKEINKLHIDLEDLKRKHANLQEAHFTLQQFADQTSQENERLTKSVKELKSAQLEKNSAVETEMEVQAALLRAERLRQIEEENLELLQKLNELHEENVRLQMLINDKENVVESMRDSLQCMEENLRCKRNELEEKTEMLESAQEQLCEANAKIAMLTTTPENEERKGNSLFAEVDDQRQQMKQLLAVQKRSYLDMKKIYTESQYEIRRLKNENIAMHKEMEACTTLFASTNKSYQDKLLERLKHATKQNERMETQLKFMHERLIELGNQKGVNWLDSILSYCKKETEELKLELRSARREQASVEEQLRNTSQQMACWRFEALKTRCILLDRENLLNNNNIKFQSRNAVEFRITEEEKQTAQPRIISTRRLSAELIKIKEKTQRNSELKVEDIQEKKEENSTDIKEELKVEDVQEKKEENAKEFKKELKVEENSTEAENIVIKVEPLESNENKENVSLNKRTSLITKPRSLFSKDEKIVTFSAASPLVHKYINNNEEEEEKEQVNSTPVETKVNNIRSKSGLVIVRNIVIKKPTTQNK